MSAWVRWSGAASRTLQTGILLLAMTAPICATGMNSKAAATLDQQGRQTLIKLFDDIGYYFGLMHRCGINQDAAEALALMKLFPADVLADFQASYMTGIQKARALPETFSPSVELCEESERALIEAKTSVVSVASLKSKSASPKQPPRPKAGLN